MNEKVEFINALTSVDGRKLYFPYYRRLFMKEAEGTISWNLFNLRLKIKKK